MPRVKLAYSKILAKHIVLSLLLGSLPPVILWWIKPRKIFLEEIKGLVPSNTMQGYYICTFLIYVLLSAILRYIWMPSPQIQGTIVYIRNIFKEAASGLKSIIQTMNGAIFIFCIFWFNLEPQSFTLSRLIFFLGAVPVFTSSLVFVEKCEQNFDY